MLYLFHGEDEYTCSEEVATLKAQVAEGGLGDINVTLLDGRRLSFGELSNACNTLPFLTSRRLLVVENLLQRLSKRRARAGGKKTAAESDEAEYPADEPGADEAPAGENARYLAQLLDYLPHLPPTTSLVLVESTSLAPSNRLLKLAQGLTEAQVRHFALFDLRRDRDVHALGDWIRRRAQSKGAGISPQAADYLIELVGNDLRALDHELEKLAGLVGYRRPIAVEDARAVVSAAREADVFALVDALGMRRRQEALRLVGRLLAEERHELYLLTMIARQVRLILVAKEMVEDHKATLDEVGKALGISASFLLRKLLDQAGQFTFAELEGLLARILALDQSLKTGRIDGALGLDLLVLEICQRRSTPAPMPHQGSSRPRTR
jgi:DNA polymerase-3 subunit delta